MENFENYPDNKEILKLKFEECSKYEEKGELEKALECFEKLCEEELIEEACERAKNLREQLQHTNKPKKPGFKR